MAHKTSKDMGFALDNAAGTLTAISGSVNNQAINHAITILDDSGMGDTQHTTLTGMVAAVTIPLNGLYNSTIDGIFGPVAVAGTSVTKTAEFKAYTGRYYTGEVNIQDYSISGTPDTLEVWSATLVASGAFTRTSVTAVA